ncbi:RibD family protein [Xanthobacter sp. KR7-65]|uniref:RibD family protein n=1 Tax=Xanthobacter sp. KR7-65 TaxID=3156612 RepID=UPI0032B5E0E9
MDDRTTRPRPHEDASARSHMAIAGRQNKGAPPVVIAQLGQSLDGRIATPSGESKYINGPHALDHLHALRASVDAVVVGVGTICADDPLLTVRRVAGRHPARVVIDPTGRADPAARCFRNDGTRRIVLRRTGVDAPVADGVEVAALDGDGPFAPAAVVAALAARGLARILVEGGPSTLSAFMEADLVDTLHVFVSPVILGAGRIGLSRKACDTLAQALRPTAHVQLFADGDVLFQCDLRRAAPAASGAPDEREAQLSDEHPGQSSSLRVAG